MTIGSGANKLKRFPRTMPYKFNPKAPQTARMTPNLDSEQGTSHSDHEVFIVTIELNYGTKRELPNDKLTKSEFAGFDSEK